MKKVVKKVIKKPIVKTSTKKNVFTKDIVAKKIVNKKITLETLDFDVKSLDKKIDTVHDKLDKKIDTVHDKLDKKIDTGIYMLVQAIEDSENRMTDRMEKMIEIMRGDIKVYSEMYTENRNEMKRVTKDNLIIENKIENVETRVIILEEKVFA